MQAVKIGAIVVALGAAGIIFWATSSKSAEVPNDDGQMSEWMCALCQHGFSLTSEQCVAAEQKAQAAVPLHCTACQEQEAYPATVCATCGNRYISAGVPGFTGSCPTCNPKTPVFRKPSGPAVAPTPEPTETPPAGGDQVPVKKDVPID